MAAGLEESDTGRLKRLPNLIIAIDPQLRSPATPLGYDALQEAGPWARGNWLVTACWLMLLRSRLLLPADAPGQQGAEEAGDQLRGNLLALQAGRALA